MTTKILCVDDDANILAAYARSLRRQYNLDTALGPETGLKRLAENGPYALVISDMNMPGMDGICFLARARQMAPDTVRMMLTGNADLKTVMDALHQGSIFRFLVKPTPPDALAQALDAGLAQFRLISAERELLEKTLSGSIRVLVEILATIDPEGFERSQGLRRDIRTLAQALGKGDLWQLELAGLLSQIGLVTIPASVVRKLRLGAGLMEAERAMLARVPEVGHNLLVNIPRLEPVARAIRYAGKGFDGSGQPADAVRGEDLPLGARLLRVRSDLSDLEVGGLSKSGALAVMQRHAERYDPRVLAAACAAFAPREDADASAARKPSVALAMRDLRVGQTLSEDVLSSDGKLLISRGHCLSEPLLERLRNYVDLNEVQEPLWVERDGA
jgi:response regulator RpfG family c-di-GMP phosphodiesterase